jgi:hypothetical protein
MLFFLDSEEKQIKKEALIHRAESPARTGNLSPGLRSARAEGILPHANICGGCRIAVGVWWLPLILSTGPTARACLEGRAAVDLWIKGEMCLFFVPQNRRFFRTTVGRL